MGRHHNGGVLMDMSVALSMDETWKEFRDADVKPNSLCRILTPDT